MKKKLVFAALVSVFFLLSACASSRSSRAIRQADRMMARQEAQAQKDYEEAKAAHYKRQAPETKKMMKEDQRRARQLNRHLRRY